MFRGTDRVVLRSNSYADRVGVASGSIQLKGAPQADAHAYSKTLKMFRLYEETPTHIVDGRPYPLHTLPCCDIRALQDIHDLIH